MILLPPRGLRGFLLSSLALLVLIYHLVYFDEFLVNIKLHELQEPLLSFVIIPSLTILFLDYVLDADFRLVLHLTWSVVSL